MSYILPPVPYINVSSTQNQTLPSLSLTPPNDRVAITYDTVSAQSGISLVSNSRITFAVGGTYLVTFSAVIDASADKPSINLWLMKNGNNINNTNTVSYVAANGNPTVCTVTVIEAFAATDYIEVYGNSTNGDGLLSAVGGSGSVPASPSIILTANKVSD